MGPTDLNGISHGEPPLRAAVGPLHAIVPSRKFIPGGVSLDGCIPLHVGSRGRGV